MKKKSTLHLGQRAVLFLLSSAWLLPASAWQPLGTGLNSAVRSIVIDSSNNLYVGGDFTTAGGTTANYIAKWNGSAWSAVGTGTDLDLYVNALAINGTDLYVGGSFSTFGGAVGDYIQKWNGSTWSAMDVGTDGDVNALAVDSTNNILYVGGAFTAIGLAASAANRVAKWDLVGNAWSATSFNDTNPFNTVNSLALDGVGNLYAGGIFITVGGISAKKIARWDGSAWFALGSATGTGIPVNGVNSTSSNGINAIVVKSVTDYGSPYYYSDLFIGGSFSKIANSSAPTANNVAEWNGWNSSFLINGSFTGSVLTSVLDTSSNNGVNSRVNALALDNTTDPTNRKLYVGGTFTALGSSAGTQGTARYELDNNRWSRLGGDGANAPSGVNALAVDQDGNVYAGGSFSVAGKNAAGTTVTANNIAVYTHTDIIANQWKLVSLPHYDVAGATVSAAFDIMPASSYNVAGDPNGWVVYQHDTASNTYSRVKTDTLAQGKGYWVLSYVDGVMDMDGIETPVTSQATNTHCTSSKGCYIVELTSPTSGSLYQLLGNPFINRVQWADVRFEVGGTVGDPATAGTAYTPSAALTATIADKQFSTYDGSSYQTCDDVTGGCTAYVKPMQGFWIKLLSGSIGQTVKLLIPKP